MPLTNALNRLQTLRNENASNINPGKNQALNQSAQPKSAFKDLTNASSKKNLNVFGGKPGSSFRTPQVQAKKESKVKERDAIHIFMDDFCSALPKTSHKFPESSWMSFDTDKIAKKFAQPLKSDYEVFKDDEFVLQAIPEPEPLKIYEDLDLSLGTDGLKVEMDDFVLQPMKIDDLPDMDFTDFTFHM